MEEKRIAIKAAKAMDLKVAGVDIIRSAKGFARKNLSRIRGNRRCDQ
jgi:glutathione synthase/RimK-type ligase-like ATP-grasp enzyme